MANQNKRGRPKLGKDLRTRVSFTLSKETENVLKKVKESKSSFVDLIILNQESQEEFKANKIQYFIKKNKSLFWDTDINLIQLKHHTFIIERVLEYGNMAAVKDLLLLFGIQEIINTVKRSKKLSKKTANFWKIYLDIKGEILCLRKELQNQLSGPWK